MLDVAAVVGLGMALSEVCAGTPSFGAFGVVGGSTCTTGDITPSDIHGIRARGWSGAEAIE
ncbi:MAG: hypothetical protein ABR562_03845 [Thermoplasmatota archaeon]|nr:hypothetical protein [Halobacteriales archaeon]